MQPLDGDVADCYAMEGALANHVAVLPADALKAFIEPAHGFQDVFMYNKMAPGSVQGKNRLGRGKGLQIMMKLNIRIHIIVENKDVRLMSEKGQPVPTPGQGLMVKVSDIANLGIAGKKGRNVSEILYLTNSIVMTIYKNGDIKIRK
jgi:hypothetical protein